MVDTFRDWKRTLAGFLTVLGLALGTLADVALAVPAPEVTSQQQQELFKAIEQMLTEAHTARQDMPKQLVSAEQIGPDKYRVRCQMVQGEGWFEVSKEGGKWVVKGINPPAGQ